MYNFKDPLDTCCFFSLIPVFIFFFGGSIFNIIMYTIDDNSYFKNCIMVIIAPTGDSYEKNTTCYIKSDGELELGKEIPLVVIVFTSIGGFIISILTGICIVTTVKNEYRSRKTKNENLQEPV